MLTPDDRIKAIDVLVEYHINTMYNHSSSIDTKKLLMCGFKGFAAFTDQEIMRALHKIRDRDYRAADILKDLAEFEILK